MLISEVVASVREGPYLSGKHSLPEAGTGLFVRLEELKVYKKLLLR